MIVGFNTDVKHRDELFHIQTEDKGSNNPTVETLVYHNGEILLSRRLSYSHMISKQDSKKRVKSMMKAQHNQVMSELKNGKFLHLISLETQTIEEKSLDEMVIDFFTKEN